MPVITVTSDPQPVNEPGSGPFVIMNLDTAATLYIGLQKSVTSHDIPVSPGNNFPLAGNRQWWTSTGPGGPDVQAAIVPEGLGTGSGASQIGQQVAQQVQQTGVPPIVPGLKSKSFTGQGAGGGGGFFTFPADGKIYAVMLDLSGGTDSSYSGGVTIVYANLKTSSGKDLAYAEIALSGPNQNDGKNTTPGFPGMPVSDGDELILDPNNNVPLTDGVFHSSAIVWYSIP